MNDVEKAEWALKKIRDERESRDYLIDAYKKEIERLQTKIKETEDKCDAKTGWLLSKLDQYLDEDGVPVDYLFGRIVPPSVDVKVDC